MKAALSFKGKKVMSLKLQPIYTGITSGDAWSLLVSFPSQGNKSIDDVRIRVFSDDLKFDEEVALQEKGGILEGLIGFGSLRTIYRSELHNLEHNRTYEIKADAIKSDGRVIAGTTIDVPILNRG